jgi:transposase
MVMLEQLVPKNHPLRLLDHYIRFDFIRTETESLYCPNNGRPAIDPMVLFKMLFIGYLFGTRSERRLVRETEINIAYRWFFGLRLIDLVLSSVQADKRCPIRESTGVVIMNVLPSQFMHPMCLSHAMHSKS